VCVLSKVCFSLAVAAFLITGKFSRTHYAGAANYGEASAADCACENVTLPDLNEKELTARWMVHSLNWGVLSTVSSRLVDEINNQAIPFGNPYSFVDGPCRKSTGTPYFYGAYMDQSFKDSLINANAAFTLSEASLPSVCLDRSSSKSTATSNSPFKRKDCQIGVNYGDPENPLCARLALTGKLVEVIDADEKEFALDVVFERQDSMKGWPQNHKWVVGKLIVRDIWLVDFFWGAGILDLDKYFVSNNQETASDEDATGGVRSISGLLDTHY
jgi:hypothetical protein